MNTSKLRILNVIRFALWELSSLFGSDIVVIPHIENYKEKHKDNKSYDIKERLWS